MNHLPRYSAALAAILLTFGVAACGGGGDETTTAADTSAADTTASVPTGDGATPGGAPPIPTDVPQDEQGVIDLIASSCEDAAPSGANLGSYCDCYADNLVKEIGVEGVADIGRSVQEGGGTEKYSKQISAAVEDCIGEIEQ